MTFLDLLLFVLCGGIAHGVIWLLLVSVISYCRDPWYDVSKGSFIAGAIIMIVG